MGSETIFEVTEAEEGGYCASALGFGINAQADFPPFWKGNLRWPKGQG